MRYFIQFAYRGSDFHGSQRQPNGITVQEVLETALETILREPTPVTFAGRTDAGVHAEYMVAHFDSDKDSSFLTGQLAARLNNLLPVSIAVERIYPVADDLHARFSAKERTYEYRITTIKNPFTQGLRTRLAPGLDYDKMNEAAQLLLGRQDFASFCRVQTDVKTTFCTIQEARWIIENDHEATFRIRADRFLRNMVRAVVGTLLEVGRGKITKQDFQKIITGKNRCLAGESAPAQGLFLTHIQY